MRRPGDGARLGSRLRPLPPRARRGDDDGALLEPQAQYTLFESASGFALFEVKEQDAIATTSDKVQETLRWAAPRPCAAPTRLSR